MLAIASPLVTLALLASGAHGSRTAVEKVQEEDTLEWLDDYGEALTRAKETGRPLFLEFRCAP